MQYTNTKNYDAPIDATVVDDIMIEELELRLELAVCCSDWACNERDWTGRNCTGDLICIEWEVC